MFRGEGFLRSTRSLEDAEFASKKPLDSGSAEFEGYTREADHWSRSVYHKQIKWLQWAIGIF